MRIVLLEFPEITDVTEMIAAPGLLEVLPCQPSAGQVLNPGTGFPDGDALGAASAEVVNLSRAGVSSELLDRAYHVVAVDIVAHLFSFIAEDSIGFARQCDFDQVR